MEELEYRQRTSLEDFQHKFINVILCGLMKFDDEFGNTMIDFVNNVQSIVENHPLYVMMETALNCNAMTDHLEPKNVYPLYQTEIRQTLQKLMDKNSIFVQQQRDIIIGIMKHFISEVFENIQVVTSHLQKYEAFIASMERLHKDLNAEALNQLKQLRREILAVHSQLTQKSRFGIIYKPDGSAKDPWGVLTITNAPDVKMFKNDKEEPEFLMQQNAQLKLMLKNINNEHYSEREVMGQRIEDLELHVKNLSYRPQMDNLEVQTDPIKIKPIFKADKQVECIPEEIVTHNMPIQTDEWFPPVKTVEVEKIVEKTVVVEKIIEVIKEVIKEVPKSTVDQAELNKLALQREIDEMNKNKLKKQQQSKKEENLFKPLVVDQKPEMAVVDMNTNQTTEVEIQTDEDIIIQAIKLQEERVQMQLEMQQMQYELEKMEKETLKRMDVRDVGIQYYQLWVPGAEKQEPEQEIEVIDYKELKEFIQMEKENHFNNIPINENITNKINFSEKFEQQNQLDELNYIDTFKYADVHSMGLNSTQKVHFGVQAVIEDIQKGVNKQQTNQNSSLKNNSSSTKITSNLNNNSQSKQNNNKTKDSKQDNTKEDISKVKKLSEQGKREPNKQSAIESQKSDTAVSTKLKSASDNLPQTNNQSKQENTIQSNEIQQTQQAVIQVQIIDNSTQTLDFTKQLSIDELVAKYEKTDKLGESINTNPISYIDEQIQVTIETEQAEQQTDQYEPKVVENIIINSIVPEKVTQYDFCEQSQPTCKEAKVQTETIYSDESSEIVEIEPEPIKNPQNSAQIYQLQTQETAVQYILEPTLTEEQQTESNNLVLAQKFYIQLNSYPILCNKCQKCIALVENEKELINDKLSHQVVSYQQFLNLRTQQLRSAKVQTGENDFKHSHAQLEQIQQTETQQQNYNIDQEQTYTESQLEPKTTDVVQQNQMQQANKQPHSSQSLQQISSQQSTIQMQNDDLKTNETKDSKNQDSPEKPKPKNIMQQKEQFSLTSSIMSQMQNTKPKQIVTNQEQVSKKAMNNIPVLTQNSPVQQLSQDQNINKIQLQSEISKTEHSDQVVKSEITSQINQLEELQNSSQPQNQQIEKLVNKSEEESLKQQQELNMSYNSSQDKFQSLESFAASSTQQNGQQNANVREGNQKQIPTNSNNIPKQLQKSPQNIQGSNKYIEKLENRQQLTNSVKQQAQQVNKSINAFLKQDNNMSVNSNLEESRNMLYSSSKDNNTNINISQNKPRLQQGSLSISPRKVESRQIQHDALFSPDIQVQNKSVDDKQQSFFMSSSRIPQVSNVSESQMKKVLQSVTKAPLPSRGVPQLLQNSSNRSQLPDKQYQQILFSNTSLASNTVSFDNVLNNLQTSSVEDDQLYKKLQTREVSKIKATNLSNGTAELLDLTSGQRMLINQHIADNQLIVCGHAINLQTLKISDNHKLVDQVGNIIDQTGQVYDKNGQEVIDYKRSLIITYKSKLQLTKNAFDQRLGQSTGTYFNNLYSRMNQLSYNQQLYMSSYQKKEQELVMKMRRARIGSNIVNQFSEFTFMVTPLSKQAEENFEQQTMKQNLPNISSRFGFRHGFQRKQMPMKTTRAGVGLFVKGTQK
ncbi:Coiled-coil_protein [Hexamita inflata]|uniref:Coiled-coil protein n=1 Tax=Hexamita inflata TaxID=28002 RepID=A0AA86US06_9EUKA|nr:Coiled-coil protein [Hexamita inflata]